MQKIQKQLCFDGISREQKKLKEFDYNLTQFILKNKNSSVLYSNKHGKVHNFTTRDSKLYFTQAELGKMRAGEKLTTFTGKVDCVLSRQTKKQIYWRKENPSYFDLKERYSSLSQYIKDAFDGYTHGVGMVRMWNISLVTSLIFGMFLMTMIYRYLGQGASAHESQQLAENKTAEMVLGVEAIDEEAVQKEINEYTAKLLAELANKETAEFEKKLKEMVKGYPIEQMVSEIAKQDRTVAIFLVAIAKKESAWGKRVPVLNGEDCYNYWGFRKKRERMGTGGHTCFDSVKDAVDSASKRIGSLVYDEKIDTPQKMVLPWKCGYDCSWDNPKAVQKWIDDVDYYFKQFEAKN